MFRSISPIICMVLCLSMPQAAEPQAAQTQPSANYPSREEIAIFELYNAHRQLSQRIDSDILDDVRQNRLSGNIHIISAMMHMIKPQGPVVFNEQLMAAARGILMAGQEPIIGAHYDALPAMSAAGYSPIANGLALVALDCASPALAYGTALIFPVGILKRENTLDFPILARDHALKPIWREVGVAVKTTNGKTSLAIVLGTGSAQRYVGGIAYRDNDRDFIRGPGEGVAGVTVRVGAASTISGPEGIWWLALDSHDSVDVTFTKEGESATRPIATGKDNVFVDWRLPLSVDYKVADRLIAACSAAPSDEIKQRGSLAALFFGSRGLCLDDARQNAIAQLVMPVRDECESLIADVQAAMASDPMDWKKQRVTFEKPWKGAIAAWFKEAEATYQQRQNWKTVLAAPQEKQAKLAASFLKPMRKQITATSDPIFAANMRDWLKELEQLSPPTDSTRRRP
jgi:hypothetical protein